MHILIHLILSALRNHATRSGTVWKDVKCERCRTAYGYELSRTVTEEGIAGRREVTRRADERLARALETGCDPHPCPACGWLQPDMARAVQRKALDLPAWVVLLAFVSLAGFVAARVAALRPDPRPDVVAGFVAAGVLFAAPVAVVAVRRVRRRFADPNAKPGGPETADLGRDFE